MTVEKSMLEVTDDSGFLALIDPDAYNGFVDEDWSLDQLMDHFRAEMGGRRLLIWGTGQEGFWRVRVGRQGSAAGAFREISGPIAVSAGRLLLTNFESLTMAAQFADVSLPQDHDRDLLLDVPSGTYSCRVLQMFDPREEMMAEGDGPEFIVEILDDEPLAEGWSEIPWSDADRPPGSC